MLLSTLLHLSLPLRNHACSTLQLSGGLGAAALCIEKNAQDHNIIQVALQQRGCAAAKRAAERANLQDRHNVGFGNIRVVVQELDAYREHAVLLGSEVCSG